MTSRKEQKNTYPDLTPFDAALHDLYYNGKCSELTLHNNYGNPEIMPVEVFFREEYDFTELEKKALSLCKGKILDIGAGAGALTLNLNNNGHDVTAVETSEVGCYIMAHEGAKNIICDDYRNIEEKFDTLLLMMNGFGLCEKLENIPIFFSSLKSLLNSGGRVIVDSSDVKYMADEMPKDRYYGEVEFCYEYESILGEWFNWLYIDPILLQSEAKKNDWHCEIVFTDEHDQYLAILKPNNYN
ncbi:class I SAM-dependent methyltransferase [Fulvivirga lutea]|uniref:Class I SAM-dependent methyltransferase n=1 Tax=Fulvivirga lutea TaxID=2810512 RepID=A0A974WGL9_9BACT|nr:class I SAM-dependent methyltransferase [Fulvivirga lutea]QSE97298.1 class I SAM-dependent methyltransferase [Fulvivirga lutea]